MGTTLRDKLNALSKDRRKAIEDDAHSLHTEYLTLRDLRKARQLTQVQLAETLGLKQPTLAQMEQNTDLMLSTLKRYVEAMGGKLNLMVEFPDRPAVHIDTFGTSINSGREDSRL
ncbi:MAG: helix-turn-helix domain-containing protein [Pseudomonadota bacterium]